MLPSSPLVPYTPRTQERRLAAALCVPPARRVALMSNPVPLPLRTPMPQQIRFLVLIIGLLMATWVPRQGQAEPSAVPVSPTEKLQPQDIAVNEPLQVPLTDAPPAVQPVAPSAVGSDTSMPAETPALAPPQGSIFSTNPAASTPPTTAQGIGWLGLAVDDSLVTGRLVIVEVTPAGPAATSGVRLQDVLLALDGQPLKTADELAAALAAIAPGKQVRMSIGRPDGIQEMTITAQPRPTTGVAVQPPRELPDTPPAGSPGTVVPRSIATPAPPPFSPSSNPPVSASVGSPAGSRFSRSNPEPPRPLVAREPAVTTAPPPKPQLPEALPPPEEPRPAAISQAGSALTGRVAIGVRTVPVDPLTQERFGLSESVGAYVIGVVADLPASRAGIPPGSVIVAFDERPVRSPQELTELVTHSRPGTAVTLQYVLPGGDSRETSLELQSLSPPLERALVGPAVDAIPEPEPTQTKRVARRPTIPGTVPSFDTTETAHRMAREIAALREAVQQLETKIEGLEQALRSGGVSAADVGITTPQIAPPSPGVGLLR